jgi:hypothetical protein
MPAPFRSNNAIHCGWRSRARRRVRAFSIATGPSAHGWSVPRRDGRTRRGMGVEMHGEASEGRITGICRAVAAARCLHAREPDETSRTSGPRDPSLQIHQPVAVTPRRHPSHHVSSRRRGTKEQDEFYRRGQTTTPISSFGIDRLGRRASPISKR